MATLPQALPRSFRDLQVCFRESKFKTAGSAEWIFLRFLSKCFRSHTGRFRESFLWGLPGSVLFVFLGGQGIVTMFLVVLAGESLK